ncbi:YAP-binding/ALF4/Glomulin [Aspergillus coremiiformis]|uniref:YAP-binding/ALF4/Glomulin n=1 Tax=Aspergillus coremiiformis TaxID=138285 RepID=A0A5N6ZE94_9EURO|nr:YAP-binding/ALF4/Glomulin [Aspergillus coremiiformis]
MAEEEDPIVQALPPATDYLTYLTLLEYQLTPARLPTLHKLLQDETLTTNIGWDLVQLLLPMIPHSLECLQDIARLGNPREVILRVSDALMQLQPEDEDEEEDEDGTAEPSIARGADNSDTKSKSATGSNDAKVDETNALPRHVMKFNSLVTMLSVLHSRIQTKSPSRFLATSLQAVLEAYTLMPTNETTIALLEFFRDVSPSKRPAPPPRAASESSVLRVSKASAPDPEAEVQSPNPSNNNEPALIKKFLQFGLIELIKSYMLSLSGPMDPGMSWTVRLQEKLQPKHLAGQVSETEVFANTKQLRERDMIMGKLTALSRDFGLDDKQLLAVVSQPPNKQPQPLDFDEPPKNVEEIPLERHGALLLLAARAAMAELFSSGQVIPIAVFPDLAQIFDHFVGGHDTPDEIAFGQPQALLDSLLTLTVFSVQQPIGQPSNEMEFRRFIVSLTACTTRQSYGSIRRIPGTILHSLPSHIARFKTIRQILEDDRFQLMKDSAVGWLKDEILDASKNPSGSPESGIFTNPHYFSVLFPLLFNSSELLLNVSSDIVASWIKFSQTLTPSIHAALNLYYILLSSSALRTQLQLEKTYIYFRNRFLEPLKSLLHAFESDLTQNGGEGKIESAVGENMCQVGMARSVGLVSHAVERVEDVVGDAFVVPDDELQEPSTDDIARVDKIRKETAL